MTILVAICLGLLGAAMGSFAAAQVWRLRARQLKADIAAGDPEADKKEFKRLKPLLESTVKKDRSRCLSCGHQLAWYDLLPVISWVSLGGKCRYCRKPIGRFELIMELGVGLFFALSYIWWPYHLATSLSITQFIVWLVIGVVLAIHVAYDAKWFLLLDSMNILLAVLAAIYAALDMVRAGTTGQGILSLVGSLAIMSGLYAIIYALSRGSWIGLGDVKLGIGLGLLLVSWQQAFVALFAANLIGTLLVLPAMATGKLTRKSRVPFGPFLIAGAIVGVWWGPAIISWYMSLTPGLFL